MWSAETAVAAYRSLFDRTPFTIVSNREPYVARREEGGRLTYVKHAGGLTAALDPVMQAIGGTWIACGSPPAGGRLTAAAEWQERLAVPPEAPAYNVRRLRLSDNEVRHYYHGYANQSLWPVCHNLLEHVRFRDRFWKAYREVNERFARVVLEEIGEAPALIWLQDYHLALAPEAIRGDRPESWLAQFWHIPWPPWDTFRVCPNHRELLQGLLANDLLAFHLQSFCENFLRCCDQALDVEVDWHQRVVGRGGHVTTLRALPISIDAESFRELASREDTLERIAELRSRFGLAGKLVGVGVDRLDYSKGILERLEALRILYRRHPELVGRFTFIQIGAPSRTEIPAYADLQRRVEVAVDELNRGLATATWRPVLYIARGLPHEELAAFYRMADVAIVSSLQNGMNLVAKEFVAAQVDRRGVLCLSEFAGAAEEFGQAITLNPFYTEGFAEDIYRALVMVPEEKRARMERMQAALAHGNVYRWVADFFTAAHDALGLERQHAAALARRLLQADSALVALDYDGTLTEIVAEPDAARLTRERRAVLEQITQIPHLRVVVVSGRSLRDTAERIGLAGATIVGNHGLELEGWSLPGIERMRPALARFLGELQAANELPFPILVEDKGATATVHLRGTRSNADRDRLLEALQVQLDRFLGTLGARAAGSPLLRLHPGKASVEVRPCVAWDKARALLHLLGRWGVARKDTFYAGDDVTDECVFAELREGIMVKVGAGRTRARYVAAGPSEIYHFLHELVQQSAMSRRPAAREEPTE